jgi:hypothetical protein
VVIFFFLIPKIPFVRFVSPFVLLPSGENSPKSLEIVKLKNYEKDKESGD